MLTTAAMTAKAIRNALKVAFPNQKFQVKSKTYAGGNAVRVVYTDFVPEIIVSTRVYQFQQGDYDGMCDLYEYSNLRDDIPQVKYVFIERKISEQFAKAILAEIKSHNYVDFPADAEIADQGTCWTVFSPTCPDGYMKVKGCNSRIDKAIINYSTYYLYMASKLCCLPGTKPSIMSSLSGDHRDCAILSDLAKGSHDDCRGVT